MNEYSLKYKKIILHILKYGVEQDCRNGKQLIIPFYNFNLDFSVENSWKLNLRKINYKPIKGEFLTLIDKNNPLTNVNQFKKNGCNYWDQWANDNYLNLDYYNMLHPQLELIINQIKKDPYSRRHVIELWNYKNVFSNKLSLPCCWHNLTFTIIKNNIFMSFSLRSNDIMIGNPADTYLAFLFHSYVAKKTNYQIALCNFNILNPHIYKEHVKNAQILLKRTEKDFDKHLYFKLKK